MPKDMVIMTMLFIFYFVFAVMVSFMGLDPSTFPVTGGNTSYFADDNATYSVSGDTELDLGVTQDSSFWTTFTRLATFRIGTLDIFPTFVVLLVNFINFICYALGFMIILRFIRGATN